MYDKQIKAMCQIQAIILDQPITRMTLNDLKLRQGVDIYPLLTSCPLATDFNKKEFISAIVSLRNHPDLEIQNSIRYFLGKTL